MTIYLNFAEINSLASLAAIVPGPARRDAVVLEHVSIKVAGGNLVAYATDRYVAARVEFNLALERDGDESEGLVEFTISGDVLKRTLAAAKRAHGYKKTSGASLVHLTPYANIEGVVDISVDGGADNLRSYPPRTPGSDRISSYPPIGRIFPESVEHVNDIAAGVPVDLELLAKIAKLRHPDDVLTGRHKTNFGAYRISLSRVDAGLSEKGAPLLLTRREGKVTVIAQPMNATAVNSKDPGAL